MGKRAIVLGCGMVGATMARDLARDSAFEVTAADARPESLQKLADNKAIKTVQLDFSDTAQLARAVAGFDIVLGALPSVLGLAALRTIIEAGKPYCDITFMPEDAMQLDAMAKQHKVTAIVDCGVSPGLSNLMIGHAHAALDATHRAEIYVGGLPKARRWPFQYKAPFAPSDVIEEYTRPARLIEHGAVVTRPALSEPELMDFAGVGTLEAFNTDGLRSLLHTVKIPHMKEKTLRYPGHIELMRVLRDTGFFDKAEIEVGGVRVRPLDVTAKLMFPKWTLEPGEPEFTVLRVAVEGQSGGRTVRHAYDLYDETDAATGTTSMARTTAFPCTIAARMLTDGRFARAGVFPPELLAGEPDMFDHFVEELAARGVRIRSEVNPVEPS